LPGFSRNQGSHRSGKSLLAFHIYRQIDARPMVITLALA
jgi:hypothetical protein